MDETKPHGIGGESPTEPIAGVEIKRKLQRGATLEKPYQTGGDAAMTKAIQQCNLPDKLAQKFTSIVMHGRDKLHLLRMLRRSEVERNFCLAYLQHHEEIFATDEQTTEEIKNIIGSEGADTTMFWTFAPYIFKSLTNKGLSDKEALGKTLLWAKDGVSVASHDRKRDEGGVWSMMHLKGLEKFDRETNGAWVLDKDPNHVSHKYTAQEADRIADLLIAGGKR